MRIIATASLTASVLALTLVAGSCADAPTQPQRDRISPDQGSLERGGQGRGHAKPGRADLLSNVRVSGVATFTKAGGITGAFTGFFTATHVDVVTDAATGKRQVTVTGLLTGIAKSTDETQSINVSETVTGILTRDGNVTASTLHPTQASCDILFLDLGPLHLDLLGLTVDLSQIVLDVNGVTGGGNLLGNLLCALLGILDPFAIIAAIGQLLDLINAILGAAGTIPMA
jgi:hypothetical protein